MEDYLELQSLFHLCKVYIYIYTDSIETFTTFTVNRVGISHQIESYDNLFNFQRKKEKKIRKKFTQIFPKNSKKLHKTIPITGRNMNRIKIGSQAFQSSSPLNIFSSSDTDTDSRRRGLGFKMVFSPRPPRG